MEMYLKVKLDHMAVTILYQKLSMRRLVEIAALKGDRVISFKNDIFERITLVYLPLQSKCGLWQIFEGDHTPRLIYLAEQYEGFNKTCLHHPPHNGSSHAYQAQPTLSGVLNWLCTHYSF